MPIEWKTIKALVHKIRLHGRREKGMAESFNELDVQHEWEEITHTHTSTKGTGTVHTMQWYMHSTSTNTGKIDTSPGLAMPEFL